MEKCFICDKTDYLVTKFPKNIVQLQEWKKNLNLNCDNKDLANKNLCIRHFPKHHHAILLNPNQRRGRYIFPISTALSDNDLEISVKSSQSNTGQAHEKKQNSNYQLLLELKNSEIFELKNKIHDLEIRIKQLLTELKQKNSLKHSIEIIKNAK